MQLSCHFIFASFVYLGFFQQLLGLLGSLKGITSDSVASQCVLKLYESGEIEMINKTEPQQLAQFGVHFTTNTDQPQACNFASFVPYGEGAPLQVSIQFHKIKKGIHISFPKWRGKFS